MKKILSAIFLIFIFGFYTLHQIKDDLQPAMPMENPLSPASSDLTSQKKYKDGTYAGSVVDAFYGNVQVEITIQGSKIITVNFLDYPNDRRTSERINEVAMPRLQQEAIESQSFDVDIVSGATQTSIGFRKSLQSALAKAS